MKSRIIVLALAIAAMLFTSCDRSGAWEYDPVEIPWSFCVIAHSDENRCEFVEGATVSIFKSEEDRDAVKNVFLEKTTDAKGQAVFSLADFDQEKKGPEACKGVYFILVKKGTDTVGAVTNYLLMNSGQTTQWVKIPE